MYHWLFNKFGEKMANILIVIWYLFLLALIVLFSPHPDGRFKYLAW